jgi:hypothetical protein
MATSLFTRTFFSTSALEPAERLTVTIAGIISGAMPTAIANENNSASMTGRARMRLMAKMKTVSSAATVNRNRENFESPTSKEVCPCFSASPAAIAPKAVRAPVPTTTPVADPSWTTVPMNAQPGWSSGSRSVVASADFTTGMDSPVRTASSHSSSSTSSRRMSAGTSAPTRSATMSPGTNSVTGTWLVSP